MLHHSDRGCTYASHDYQAILQAQGIACSMSRTGNGYDNAVMESFFSTVKTELGEHFASEGAARRELFDYLEVFYNQRRRHSTLGYLSPAAFERQAGEESSLVAVAHAGAPERGIVHPAGLGGRRSSSLL